MPLADWNDVERARKAADAAAADETAKLELAESGKLGSVGQRDHVLNEAAQAGREAIRLELRALGVTITYAVDEMLRGR